MNELIEARRDALTKTVGLLRRAAVDHKRYADGANAVCRAYTDAAETLTGVLDTIKEIERLESERFELRTDHDTMIEKRKALYEDVATLKGEYETLKTRVDEARRYLDTIKTNLA